MSREDRELRKRLRALYGRMATERTSLDLEYLETGVVATQREIERRKQMSGALSLCTEDAAGGLSEVP